MPLLVYVAGSSRNRERARRFVERVHAHDLMQLTYDWIADVDLAAAAGIHDCNLSNEARAAFASRDLEGIADCDALVVLAETEPTGRGMWVELGYALALADHSHLWHMRGPVVIVSGGDKRSIFTSPGVVDFEVPFVVGEHDARAFELLEQLAVEHDNPEPITPDGALDHKGRP